MSMGMTKAMIVGWVLSLLGTAIWIYGYFVAGHPAVFNWPAFSPWWIAEFLPNRESELGMVLVFASMIPMYWPSRRA